MQESWTQAGRQAGLPVAVGHPDMPPLSHFEFEHPRAQALRTLYCQMMLDRGYLDNGNFYATCAHTPEILAEHDRVVREVFEQLSRIVAQDRVEDELRGPVAETGFARLTDA